MQIQIKRDELIKQKGNISIKDEVKTEINDTDKATIYDAILSIKNNEILRGYMNKRN